VYIDLGFFDELRNRFGAPGDFAQAYVLAHEVGHHVQHLLGIDLAVRQAIQQRPDRAGSLSVAVELQADCLAGIWAHSTARRDLLEGGDIEEGLQAASGTRAPPGRSSKSTRPSATLLASGQGDQV
jgi:uncharacterized protein